MNLGRAFFIKSVKAKLREVMVKDPILVIHSQTSDLDKSLRMIFIELVQTVSECS